MSLIAHSRNFELGEKLPLMSQDVISFASSGNNTLVSGVASQTIRVYKIFFVLAGDVNYKFIDGASDMTGVMTGLSAGSFVLDFDDESWLSTSAGNDLILNLSSAVQVSGRIFYFQD